jgi:hypothetical protein
MSEQQRVFSRGLHGLTRMIQAAASLIGSALIRGIRGKIAATSIH